MEMTEDREKELLVGTLAYLEQDSSETSVMLEKAREIGFSDDEIQALGFSHFLDGAKDGIAVI